MEVVAEKEERVDKYLASVTEYSRSIIQKMIDNNEVLVNENIVKANYILKENDLINLPDDYYEDFDVEPENIPLNIVYEDNDLMVINKPSGMVVHPGNGNASGTLVNALKYYTNNLSDKDAFRPGIVHRIDKDTSGLIMIAKNNKCHDLLAEGFKNKTIVREYVALLVGNFSNNNAIIDAPIGRDPKERKRMCVTSINSKRAVTHLTVLKRYKGYTLVKLKLETGRTHQIRVHMKYVGYPVYNDPVYTNNKCSGFGQFLHSSTLSFIHPITGKKMFFECELPNEFKSFIDTLID